MSKNLLSEAFFNVRFGKYLFIVDDNKNIG